MKPSRVVATYKAAATFCRIAPESVTARLAFPIGAVAAAFQREPRKIAERNLRRALGAGLHGRELDRLSRGVFVSYARYFIDSFRLFHEGNEHYTWWSHFGHARERNVGWRIDYCMVSDSLKPLVKKANIHPDILGSDHCPVSVEISL